jgi:hypothetical protein
LYVTIRGVAFGQFIAYYPLWAAIAREIDAIRGTVSSDYYSDTEAFEVADKQISTAKVKVYIESVFHALISLICLWQLFSVL